MSRLPILKGKPRPYKTGRMMGKSLRETANILYLLDNHEQYLEGIKDEVDHALEIVRNQIKQKDSMNRK
jgi:hypothetical protein